MSNPDDDYAKLLAEELKSQRKQILEALEPLPRMAKDIAKLKEDMTEVKADIKVIRAVVADQSKQLHNHEICITSLETA